MRRLAKFGDQVMMGSVDESNPEIVNAHGAKAQRLVPEHQPRPSDIVGALRGQFVYPEDFNDPDPQIEAMFGMR